MQQLLTGNELASTSATGAEEDAAELAKKQETYSLKLVDVNSTNKGTKSGGVQSFSAMVVVGNHDVSASTFFCLHLQLAGLATDGPFTACCMSVAIACVSQLAAWRQPVARM